MQGGKKYMKMEFGATEYLRTVSFLPREKQQRDNSNFQSEKAR